MFFSVESSFSFKRNSRTESKLLDIAQVTFSQTCISFFFGKHFWGRCYFLSRFSESLVRKCFHFYSPMIQGLDAAGVSRYSGSFSVSDSYGLSQDCFWSSHKTTQILLSILRAKFIYFETKLMLHVPKTGGSWCHECSRYIDTLIVTILWHDFAIWRYHQLLSTETPNKHLQCTELNISTLLIQIVFVSRLYSDLVSSLD